MSRYCEQRMVFRSSFDRVRLDASASNGQAHHADCPEQVRTHDVGRLASGPTQLLLKRQQELQRALETQGSCDHLRRCGSASAMRVPYYACPLLRAIKASRRRGLSRMSSCKQRLRLTAQISPSTSYSIRAERPVRRWLRNSSSNCHIGAPSRRMTISRSENDVVL